jgi:hypothetical protein
LGMVAAAPFSLPRNASASMAPWPRSTRRT